MLATAFGFPYGALRCSTVLYGALRCSTMLYGSTALRLYALRLYGSTALRLYGSTALRLYGSTALRLYGSTALRLYGSTALRLYDATVHNAITEIKAHNAITEIRSNNGNPCNNGNRPGLPYWYKFRCPSHNKRGAPLVVNVRVPS